MAFEAFLNQDQAKPRKGRRLTHTLSLGFHGALLVVGVLYSFWHVEELIPSTVTVTFMAAPPPPPPPPPPPKKRSSTKPKVQPVEIVQPKMNQIVQPKEEPEPVEEDEGEDDGVEGGVEGGVKGGVIGGVVGGVVGSTAPTGPPPPPPVEAPKILPPNIAGQQKLHAPDPRLPEQFKRLEANYVVLAKICVTTAGAVSDVKIMKSADPQIDIEVVNTVKTWKFKPLMVNNNPVPFCYVSRFIFETHR